LLFVVVVGGGVVVVVLDDDVVVVCGGAAAAVSGRGLYFSPVCSTQPAGWKIIECWRKFSLVKL
jgi:hypothetical protein